MESSALLLFSKTESAIHHALLKLCAPGGSSCIVRYKYISLLNVPIIRSCIRRNVGWSGIKRHETLLQSKRKILIRMVRSVTVLFLAHWPQWTFFEISLSFLGLLMPYQLLHHTLTGSTISANLPFETHRLNHLSESTPHFLRQLWELRVRKVPWKRREWSPKLILMWDWLFLLLRCKREIEASSKNYDCAVSVKFLLVS